MLDEHTVTLTLVEIDWNQRTIAKAAAPWEARDWREKKKREVPINSPTTAAKINRDEEAFVGNRRNTCFGFEWVLVTSS